MAKARITLKGVLTVGEWADVFHDYTPKEREFLRGVALDTEDYYQEEIQKVSVAKGDGAYLERGRSQEDRR